MVTGPALWPSPLVGTVTGEPVGGVRVNVMAPLGASPPLTTALSLVVAVPTTFPFWDAVVLIEGLALMVVAVSPTPLSWAPLLRASPARLACHVYVPT